MADRSGPAAAPLPLSRIMSLKREIAAQRDAAEPAFEDADVDHDEPRRRRRQQQQSREDVVIIVSDSDTEDEADEKDRAPLSAQRTPVAAPPAPASSSAPAASAAASTPAVASTPQPPTAKKAAPQQTVPAVQPQVQLAPSASLPAAAASSAPQPPPTPSAVRPTALHTGNGHKRAAIEQPAAAAAPPAASSSPRASPASRSSDDDMPPLIPPPPAPPAPLHRTSLTIPQPSASQPYPPIRSAPPQHQPPAHTYPPTQPPMPYAQPPPSYAQPPPVNDYSAAPSLLLPPVSSACSSPVSISGTGVADSRISLFLQSLLVQTVTRPLTPHCFACQCALSPSPTSAADSSFCCPTCRTHYHSRCVFSCPRHNCLACIANGSGKGIEVRASQAADLYQCLLCPRSFCFAHASTALYSFSSLPNIVNLPSYSPSLLTALVGAVLHNGDAASWYTSVSPTQIGVCRFCSSDVADEESWRQLQAKRRMRIITEQM